jgi:hypothetical protein
LHVLGISVTACINRCCDLGIHSCSQMVLSFDKPAGL